MTPPRVLIHRPGSLGDTVVALPCFHLIRGAFPIVSCGCSRIRRLPTAPRRCFQSWRGAVWSMDISNIRCRFATGGVCGRWPAISAGGGRPSRFIWRRASAGGMCCATPRSFGPCGVKKIFGLPLVRDLLEVRIRPDGLYEREAERLLRCLAPLGTADIHQPANWDLHLTPQEQEGARRLVAQSIGREPFIALCIGTKQSAKDWGLAHWLALVRQLHDVYRHRLVFIGAASDFALSDAIARNWPARCVNLCGAPCRFAKARR